MSIRSIIIIKIKNDKNKNLIKKNSNKNKTLRSQNGRGRDASGNVCLVIWCTTSHTQTIGEEEGGDEDDEKDNDDETDDAGALVLYTNKITI